MFHLDLQLVNPKFKEQKGEATLKIHFRLNHDKEIKMPNEYRQWFYDGKKELLIKYSIIHFQHEPKNYEAFNGKVGLGEEF